VGKSGCKPGVGAEGILAGGVGQVPDWSGRVQVCAARGQC